MVVMLVKIITGSVALSGSLLSADAWLGKRSVRLRRIILWIAEALAILCIFTFCVLLGRLLLPTPSDLLIDKILLLVGLPVVVIVSVLLTFLSYTRIRMIFGLAIKAIKVAKQAKESGAAVVERVQQVTNVAGAAIKEKAKQTKDVSRAVQGVVDQSFRAAGEVGKDAGAMLARGARQGAEAVKEGASTAKSAFEEGLEKARPVAKEAAEAARMVATQGSKRAIDVGKKVSSSTSGWIARFRKFVKR